VMCRLRDREVAAIGSRPTGAGPDLPPAWGTYIQVASVDDTVAAATASGGDTVMAAFDSLDGGRMAVLADPAGAVSASGSTAPTAGRGSSTNPARGR
jgi:predicted enzyme related to lactoylglutathione lyase